MFKSIRWKFIVVYFLLVFIAMTIVGVFIVERIKVQQLSQVTRLMETTIEQLTNYSSSIDEDNWLHVKEELQSSIDSLSLLSTDRIYLISNKEKPIVVATSAGKKETIVNTSAFEHKEIDTSLLLEAMDGEKVEKIVPSKYSNSGDVKHYAWPVKSQRNGSVKGIIYMTSDLKNVNDTREASKTILIEASLIALIITVFLGFLIAKSIMAPINDLTEKIEKMSNGDFNQKVEVRSQDEVGQLANMFNILTDELNLTLSQIFSEKSKMEAILNYMSEGILAIDTKGGMLHANPIALNIMNIDLEEAMTYGYIDIAKKMGIVTRISDIRKSKELRTNEILQFNNMTYSVEFAAFKNKKDEIEGIILVIQDITKQYRLENMRREFVANVSHELKTPLTVIKSYTETLRDGAAGEPELADMFLRTIDEECDRMSRLVRDLLKLSSFDYNKTDFKMTDINLKQMMDSIYRKMKIKAEEKEQLFIVSISHKIPHVYGDKDSIEQVIINIISNAIKYTPDGGKIDVEVYQEGKKIAIDVSDDGMGIPKKDLKRIFERFYRVDKARSRELGGTGLGLSIAKEIVKAHGGKIVIDSEEEKGTDVKILLPISESYQQPMEADI